MPNGTTLEAHHRGPLVVAQLTGTAHALMMDMFEYDPLPIINGESITEQDGTVSNFTGCQAVVRHVARYFKEDAQSDTIRIAR